MKPLVRSLAITCLPALGLAACQERAAKPQPSETSPRIKPEETDWQETSLVQDVMAFANRLASSKLPGASKLRVTTYGKSVNGRPLLLVQAATAPLADAAAVRASSKLRILVTAGCNGGQVDGKEAVQLLLRDIAEGKHGELLDRAVVLIAPVVNPDGNDALAAHNRPQQNGPLQGVGTRGNAEQIDPDVDTLKLASAEVRALVAMVRDFDPHLLIDLHTTERAEHGYHLTYSPCQSPNVDKALDTLTREKLLAPVRKRVAANHGFRTFYGGRFLVPPAPEFGWVATEPRPRTLANYYGLRNRIGVRGDAYAYRSFPTRVNATHAFLAEALVVASELATEIRNECDEADKRVLDAAGTGLAFGYETELGKIFHEDVLVGKVQRFEAPEIGSYRLVAHKDGKPLDMPVQASFIAKKHVAIPEAWVVPADATEVVEVLRRHGIEVEELTKPAELEVETFGVEELKRAKATTDGHNEILLSGRFEVAERSLPAGTRIVRGKQRLARLAAQLLEPVSEDSLTTWNFFDDQLLAKTTAKRFHPILRLRKAAKLETKKLDQP